MRLSVIIVILLINLNWLSGQCTYSQSLAIPDEGSASLSFLISNAAKNKLGTDNFLCGVSIKFRHEAVGDLDVHIISPSGQSLQLIGPGGSTTNITDGTLWDVSFVQCFGALSAEPDPGISSIWDDGELWGTFENYNGSYYPYNNGCLEDLNTGSVNGTWTLLFEDAAELDTGVVESVTLIFCDEELNCTICSPPKAQPVAQNLEHCQGTDFLNGELNYTFLQSNTDTINYRFTYTIFSKTSFSGYTRDTSITTFDTGQYKLCLLTYALADSLSLPKNINLKNETLYNAAVQNQGVCALLNGCINLKILPVSDTIVKKFELCEGQSITQNGVKFDKEGSFFITSSAGKCDSIINVVIDKIDLTTTITKSKPILTCTDKTITLTAQVNENKMLTYKWSTINGNIIGNTNTKVIDINVKGKYYLEVSYQNCIKLDSIEIMADVSLPSVDLAALPITCARSETTVQLTTVSTIVKAVWTGPAYTVMGNTIKTFNKGMYSVTFTDNNNCEVTNTITIAEDFAKPAMTINFKDLSCQYDSIQVSLVDSMNIADITWLGTNVSKPKDLYNYFTDPGTYYLSLVGFNGCTDSVQIDLKDKTYVIDVTVDPDTIDCFRSRALLTTISTRIISSAKWFFPSGDSLVTPELQTPIPGIYNLVVVDSNGCTGMTQVEVKKDTIAPSITLTNKVLTCNPDSVQLYADDFNAEYAYLWYNATFSSPLDSPFVKVAGIYNVQVTDKNGCSASSSITIIPDLTLPNVSFILDTLKCGATIALLTPSDTLGYDFTWKTSMINAPTNPYGKVSNGGKYIVDVINRISGCRRQYELQVIDIRNYPVFTITADTIGCSKDSTQIVFSSTLPFTSTLWQKGVFTSSETSPFVKSPGLYYITVGDKDGCTFTDSIEVIKNLDLPIILTTSNTVTCDTAAVSISASIQDVTPMFTWYFKGQSIGTGPQQNVHLPGTYKVIAMNSRGCRDSSDVVVTADTIKPLLNVLPYGRLNCINKTLSITVNANEAITEYVFTGKSIVSQNDNMVVIDSAGIYTLTVTDQSKCKNTIDFTVQDSSRFIAVSKVAQDISCDSIGKVNLTFDLPPDSIVWQGPTVIPLNQSKFTSNKAGIYNYRVVSKDGCITLGSVDLKIDTLRPAIVKIINDTIDCTNAQVNIGIEVNDPVKTIVWNGLVDVTKIVTVSNPNTYSGTVTGTNGCKSVFSIKVIKDITKPMFTIKGDTIDCKNSKIDLELVSAQQLPLTTWTTPDMKNLVGQKVKVEMPGKYYVIAKGLNGCPQLDSITIVNNLTQPIIDLQDTFLLPCNFSPIKLSVSSKDSLIDFRWVGVNKPFVSTEKNPSINKEIKIKLFTAGTNGCNAIDSTLVVLDTIKPKFGFINDTIVCVPSVANLIALNVSDDKSFSWVDSKGITYTGDTLKVNKADTYKLVVIGNNFCKDSVLLVVPIDTIVPLVDLTTADSFLCQIKSIRINGNINGDSTTLHTWSTTDGNFVDKSTLSAEIDKAGTYILSAVNPFSGCADSDTLVVVQDTKSNIKFDIALSSPVCKDDDNGKITLSNVQNAFGPVRTQLNDKDFLSKLKYEGLSEGKYRLTMMDSLGCAKDTVFNLASGFSFEVILPADTLIELGQSVDISFITQPVIGNFQDIEWISAGESICNNCLKITSTPTEDALIFVNVVDSLGCRSQDSMLVIVNAIPLIDLPNIIRPGLGNENGKYVVPNLLAFKKVILCEIYDSWGNILFKKENFQPGDPDSGWDGTFNGNSINPGVYVVNLKVELNNGQVKHYVKDITVVH